jgi:hypothetical protein
MYRVCEDHIVTRSPSNGVTHYMCIVADPYFQTLVKVVAHKWFRNVPEGQVGRLPYPACNGIFPYLIHWNRCPVSGEAMIEWCLIAWTI